MSQAPIDAARPVREGEELDLAALQDYLSASLDGYKGPVEVQQFPSGHSNLTYLLKEGERELVLRRPPFGGEKIKTAHDMGREFRILSGLCGHFPKAPRPLLNCTDESVLGASFYIMERVQGVILRNQKAAEKLAIPADTMEKTCTALVDGLAELHAVDVEAAGLASEGRPLGYVERQISGWTKRYFNAKTDEFSHVEEVAAWLNKHQPTEQGAALIHGDYKYDNLVLDPDDLSKVVAILDWEMATVGDPMMDLGTSLAYWIDPNDPDDLKMVPVGPTLMPGNLDRRQVMIRYAETSERSLGNPVFYYVYGLFKVAVIAQQIYRRFKDGLTADPRFAMMIFGVDLLGKQAARAIDKGRIYDLG